MKMGTGAHDWSIEHLMPQKLSAAWQSDLKAWRVSDPTSFNQEYGDTIGNLTVTVYNSNLSNASFEEKKSRLISKKHKLELTKDFLAAKRWGKPEIRKRSEGLAREALQVWPR